MCVPLHCCLHQKCKICALKPSNTLLLQTAIKYRTFQQSCPEAPAAGDFAGYSVLKKKIFFTYTFSPATSKFVDNPASRLAFGA